MSKKSLPILLVLPFAVGILSVYAVNFSVNLVSEDLQDIQFDYRQNEGFMVDSKTLLKATPIGSDKALQDLGNVLVWTSNDTDIANVVVENDIYYLNALKEGQTTITVSNVRQTISKSFNAIVYKDGAIIINTKDPISSARIDNIQYYGEYDFNDDHQTKTNKTIELDVEVLPNNVSNNLVLDSTSNNVLYSNNTISFTNIKNDVEEGYVSFKLSNSNVNSTFYFNIVKDGYNIYDYDDLLYCTNYSLEGNIGVLQTNLESLQNTYKTQGEGNNKIYIDEYLNDNTKLFGNYDFNKQEFSFADEVYKFITTYNTKYIDDFNQNHPNTPINKQLITGIHIQKDFYGNGYIINGHNLTYPTQVFSQDGTEVVLPGLNNLFKGPLPFLALGDPTTEGVLIKAFGQDNSLMYVEGNNITLNDLNIRNCDFGNNLNNLNYVGTGIDVHGDNITIQNSQIRNAKNNLRVYSSMNFTLDNSLLTNARQFLLSVGVNEFEEIDHAGQSQVYDLNGNLMQVNNEEYFKQEESGLADTILMNMATYGIRESASLNNILQALNSMQDVLNPASLICDSDNNPIYKNTLNINDTYFYQSGIASISLETMFNGPYIYNSLPSLINSLLGIDDIYHASGVNYPSQVVLNGNTKFYDYKNVDSIDVSCIIEQNIVEWIERLGGEIGDIFEGLKISTDLMFPYRTILKQNALAMGIGYEVKNNESTDLYVNTPIVYYGGGLNLSTVIDNTNSSNELSSEKNIDILNYSLTNISGQEIGDMVANVLSKCVSIAIGFSPFKVMGYKNGYLYGETPNINDLKNNMEV